RGNWIELEEAEPPYGLEHPARRAVKQLGPDGDPTRLLQRDSSSPAGHGDIISDQSRWARAEPRFIHTSVPRGRSILGSLTLRCRPAKVLLPSPCGPSGS